jgi:long-chain fatty acid transport protein
VKRLVALVCLVACGGAPSVAHAAGLYVTDRGVRPLGRGGAFVAGADDLGAIWYNPAGLADAGSSVLVDFAWPDFNVQYTRQLRIQNPDGTIQEPVSPTVNGSNSFLPYPTIAGSYAFGPRKQLTVAFGVLAPYISLTTFPMTIKDPQTGAQVASPARYAMGSFNGSLMAVPGAWIAWEPVKQFRIGAGLMALAGTFQTTVTFSTSPATGLLAAAEDPSYDSSAQLSAGPVFAPAGNIGITVVPVEEVRFGLSGQTPMVIDAPAQLRMQLPSASIYQGASQDGTSAHIHFVLPAILRAGVEVRPAKGLRIEAAYVRELWSEQQTIDIGINNISLDNVGANTLGSKVAIPNITFPRGFQDSNSYRLGAEYHYSIGGYPVDTRLGFSYETSGVPTDYVSISSLDFTKVIASIGGSLYVSKHWRFDGTYAHVFYWNTYVDPNTAAIGRVNPIAGNPAFAPVNGGWYSATADVFGVGMNYKFQ